MSKWTKATRLAGLVGAAALLGGLALSASAAVHAQVGTPTPASNVGGPSSVPSARFYGSVAGAAGASVPSGTTVTASIGGVACGFGTVSGSTYVVDVQAIAGCTAGGATVSFSIGGMPATQTGTLPSIEGTAVNLNLTAGVAATATPAPAPPAPPAPPRPATPAPQPPAPPRPATPVATAGQRPTGPVAQKPGAQPVAQKPGAYAPAPAVRVALPNTGTGSQGGRGETTNVALLAILLGVVTLSTTGLVVFRRSR